MRYKCIVSYDGTEFNGWQLQKSYRSVQQEIQQAISKIANQPIKIVGAGRTDSHVHAVGQCFHFDLDKQYKDIRKAINSQLPKDIYIREVEIVDESFHSRFSALVEHSLSIALQKSIPVGMQYLPSKQPSSPDASPRLR